MIYSLAKAIVKVIVALFFRVKVENPAGLDVEGKAIFCANHVHWSDPLFLAVVAKRPVHYMAKKSLFKKGLLNWFFTALGCIPVNRDGNDIASMKRALKVLSQDQILGLFPQGTRRMDLEGCKPGIAAIALMSKAQIVPVYLEVEFKLFGKILIRVGESFALDQYYGSKKFSAQDYEKIATEDIFQRIVALKEV